MDLYYNHEMRTIENGDGEKCTYEEACRRWDDGEFGDCNIVFVTLRKHGGDMDAVDNHYQIQDEYR